MMLPDWKFPDLNMGMGRTTSVFDQSKGGGGDFQPQPEYSLYLELNEIQHT